MKIQVGSPARGNDFFLRKNLIEKAWDMIAAGDHTLIAAPRRVGKTSLMYYLLDNPKGNYFFLYIITESINNENEFFRRIVNKLLKTDYVKNSQKIIAFLEKHKPDIKKLGLDSIEFGVSEELNYWEILNRILKSSYSGDKKIVIMLDEFPQTLENIKNDEGESAARHFLQRNRELRQDNEISKNVIFIYTGSIGLENVVSDLNATKTINDLSRLKIPPFTKEEAKEFMSLLLENCDFDLSPDLIDNILHQIEWLIPFYIQSIIFELKNIYRENDSEQLTGKDIKQAFTEMLEQRQHFEHWHTRLRVAFKGDNYSFVKELLSITSEKSVINANEIYNLAMKYDLQNLFKDIVNSLIYDGYINNNDDIEVYRFNSPILRMWWRKNVAS